jgi:hypothetical protein
MPLVVADTSPIFYLLSIGQIDLLPLVPDAVYRELSHAAAPEILRRWTAELPDWRASTAFDLDDHFAFNHEVSFEGRSEL